MTSRCGGRRRVPAEIGTTDNTCVLKARAKCAGVVAKWTVEHHGNAKKAQSSNAKLHGADFRGASLTDVNLRYATFCKTTMPDGSINNANCP